MNIFVPGRVCLFGEHSDWAGGYRRINAEIEKGHAIITGTNQGLHAEVTPHPTQLVLKATLPDGSREGPYEVAMEREALLEEAGKGGFFSYAAGVALQVLTHYRVRGLVIDNYLTDLPVKKGLSSSAAICVLIARAFNRAYDLKLTTQGEMEIAYFGEITTPSRCGRMDQGCAYGNRPILMTFDGDRIDVQEIAIGGDLHFVLVDLQGHKDTVEILSRLNHCYPFAENDTHRDVQRYLGETNASIVQEATQALHDGDTPRIGQLMQRAQSDFDRLVQPACPSQLDAPLLHKVLSYPPIQPYIHGGKGVGSQGDGTAQLIARDSAGQDEVIRILQDELGMPCLKLDIKSPRQVRKAVIPAAGFGTRLFPATKALKKELFPIIDKDGRAKPVILAIVEEALSAGIEEICILVQTPDLELFTEVFSTPPRIENFRKLSKENQQYCDYLMDIGHRVTFLPQDTQEGFGHAVYCAREWVGKEPFLLLLGDHLYSSDTETCCARQILDEYERCGESVVGLKVTPAEQINRFGCVTGTWESDGEFLAITEFYEKPEPEYARQHLQVEDVGDDQFLALFGQYVLDPQIFTYLEDNIRLNIREQGEFQLTSCLDRLRKEIGVMGCIVKGRRFDIGAPDSYRRAIMEFSDA